jgi:hypothetical protein
MLRTSEHNSVFIYDQMTTLVARNLVIQEKRKIQTYAED